MTDVLVANDLAKSFGDLLAVDGVSFNIEEGETFGLLGPNGAGKTTSISMIAGLLERDGGSVEVAGQPISAGSPRGKGAIGLVPQDLAIYPDLTATENLRFFGRLYGLDSSKLKTRIEEVLEVIGLADRADDPTKEFSGGMKRRLNIGIGLLHMPQLLILDEPTVGVDPQSRNSILESVESLSDEGMAVLYTTHYMEEAERLCDRVAIIDQGVIKAEGTRRELVSMVGEKDRVSISGDVSRAGDSVGGVAGVTEVSATDHSLEILVDDAGSVLPELLARVSASGGNITGVEVVEPNLEAVFLHLTGKALRTEGMPAAFLIAGKDLRLRVRDRSALIIGILAPLILAFIFNLIFGGAVSSGELGLDYGLVDLDGSEVSDAFGAVLDDLAEQGILAALERYPSQADAESAVEDGEVDAFFLVPSGFGAAVATRSPEIQVIGNVDSPTATQIAASIAEQFATGVEATRIAIVTTAEVMGVAPTPEFVAGLQGEPSTAAFSYALIDDTAETRQIDPTTYYAAGMAIFFMFFTVQFGVNGLLEEGRDGTLMRLFAAPISRWSVVLGKALLSFALGAISMTTLVVSTTLLMGAEWGPPLGVALLVIASIAAGTALMGLVAALANTPEGAGNLGAIIAVTLGLLGGVFFPLGQGDDLMAQLTYITPHAWFLRGLGDIAGGASWTAALPSVFALIVFTLVTGLIGWLTLRRRLRR